MSLLVRSPERHSVFELVGWNQPEAEVLVRKGVAKQNAQLLRRNFLITNSGEIGGFWTLVVFK